MRDNIFEDDWEKFDCYTPVFRHKNLTPRRLAELKERAFVSYYFRPRWLAQFCRRFVKDMFIR
jgi:hypothetical protein